MSSTIGDIPEADSLQRQLQALAFNASYTGLSQTLAGQLLLPKTPQSQPTLVAIGDSITAGGNNGSANGTVTGSNLTGTATFTNHGLQTGNLGFLSGFEQAAFNGLFTNCTRVSANVFTFTSATKLPAVGTPSTINGVLAATQFLNQLYTNDRNFCEMANAALGHPIANIINVGGSGQGSAQMLARFGTDVLAQNPSIIFLASCAVNDLAASVPIATIQANITNMVLQGLRFGAIVLLATITPRNGLTTAQMMTKFALNRWIRQLCSVTPNLMLVDFDAVTVDYSSTTSSWIAAYQFDGTHPNATGAIAMANNALKPVLAQIFPQTIKTLDVYNIEDSATLNATATQLCVNPLLTGTGGTVSGAGLTGTAPDAWTIVNGGGPTTVSLPGVARTDGVGLDWQWTISGVTGGAVDVLSSDVFSFLTAGDRVQFICNLAGASLANITGVQVWLDIVQSGVTYLVAAMAQNGDGGAVSDFNWILKSDPTVFPSGAAPSNYRFRVKIVCGANPAGVFKLGSVSIRKGV